MSVFVYDGNPGRDWELMLDGPTELAWDGENLVGGNPAPGDVLVCHRVQQDDIEHHIKKIAATGVLVIKVSANNVERSAPQGNYYRRAKGVGRPTDTHFTECFRYFLRYLCANGSPDWNLIEGPPPPDALFAYHLLDLFCKGDAGAMDACRALRAIAIAEAQAIAGARGVTPLKDIDESTARRVFLRAC